MNVETITDVKQDGELWYVCVGDHRLGYGCHDQYAAEALQRWFCSAQQDIVNWVADMIDKAFAETGK